MVQAAETVARYNLNFGTPDVACSVEQLPGDWKPADDMPRGMIAFRPTKITDGAVLLFIGGFACQEKRA
jgi:hypothetical protein